jgi:hypothetical protein
MRIGPFTVVPDLAAYLAALRQPAIIPVLDGDPVRLREVADLMAEPDRPEARRQPDAAILLPPDSAAAPLGAALADRLGATVATWADAGPAALVREHRQATHLAVVALAGELDTAVVIAMSEALGELRSTGLTRAGLGFAVAPTVAELTWLVAKGLSAHLRRVAPRGHLCVAPRARHAPDEPAVEWVLGAAASRARLAPMLCAEHTAVVSVVSGAREHAVMLPDTAICGADQGRRPLPGPGSAAPTCAYTDRCFLEDLPTTEVIEASRIRADVVFANACMSWRPGHGLVSPDYQLTNGFLRGTVAAYVGAVHSVQGDLRLPAMFHAGAAAGHGVGELGARLNDQARAARSDVPWFAVLGLPWVRQVAEPGAPREERRRAGTPPPVDARAVGRVLEGLAELPHLGWVDPEQDGELRRLQRRASSLVTVLRRPAPLAGDEVAALRAAGGVLERNLAERLHEYGQTSFSGFNGLWEGTLAMDSAPTPGACPYCGGRLSVTYGRHPVLERVGRRALKCAGCGPILDLPTRSVLATLTLDGDDRWQAPGTAAVTVVAKASDLLTREVDAVLAVHSSGARKLGLHYPPPSPVLLRHGDECQASVTVRLDANALPYHMHLLRAVVIAEGRVHYGTRVVSVRPAADRAGRG